MDGGGKEKKWADWVADDLRLFGIWDEERWKTVTLDPASGDRGGSHVYGHMEEGGGEST